MLAAVYGQLGRKEEAASAIDTLLGFYPDFRDRAREELEAILLSDPEYVDRMLEGLEKAGLFDEPEAPSRPVIAVLPFTNMSGDPEQEYFADGITEDIITRLARFSDLAVIAQNSTFQYKGENVDIRAVAEDLGATHVVEGSVRKAGETVRVTVQVLSAADGTHLWVETYDRALTAANLFAVQDEITAQVAATIADEWGILAQADIEATRNKPPESLESYECVLMAAEYFGVEATAERHLVVRDCAERATRRDPSYAEGWRVLAQMYLSEHALRHNPLPGSLDRALSAAKRAVELDPRNERSQGALARVHCLSPRDRRVSR